MSEPLPDLGNECFFIAPIGSDGSTARERSDEVMEYIVAPAAEELGLVTVRGDRIGKPGQMTSQVIEHVVGARASVVDLSEANLNAYYEMAVRHTLRLPTVLICKENEKLPFDIIQMRTIFFDHTSLRGAAECRDQITQHLAEALNGAVDSPIEASVSLQSLERGSEQERALAHIIDVVDDIQIRMPPAVRQESDGASAFNQSVVRMFASSVRAIERRPGDHKALDEIRPFAKALEEDLDGVARLYLEKEFPLLHRALEMDDESPNY